MRSRQVGRGGRRGKTSGRGTKGQKARAGRKIRPEARDVIMRLPKLRGYRFKSRFESAVPVSITVVDRRFSVGDAVSPKTLAEKKVIRPVGGTLPPVKLLGGALSKRVVVEGCAVSASARKAILDAGGSVAS